MLRLHPVALYGTVLALSVGLFLSLSWTIQPDRKGFLARFPYFVLLYGLPVALVQALIGWWLRR